MLRSTSCVHLDISHRSDISFYYFSITLKYAPLDVLSLFFTLYLQLSSLTYFRTILLDRGLLFHPRPLFSFFQACSDSSLSRLPMVVPSNRPLSIHFFFSSLRSSLSRASFSKSISIGLLFRSLVHDRRSPPASSLSSLFSILHESSVSIPIHFLLSLSPLISFGLSLSFFLSFDPSVFLSLPVSFSHTRRRL